MTTTGASPMLKERINHSAENEPVTINVAYAETKIADVRSILKEGNVNSSEFEKLEKDLDQLDSDISLALKEAGKGSILVPYQIETKRTRMELDLVKKGLPYEDAEKISYGMIAEKEQMERKNSNFKKVAYTIIGIGAGIGLLFGGYSAFKALNPAPVEIVHDGERLPALTGFQGLDPLVPAPLDKTVVLPTDVAGIIQADPYTFSGMEQVKGFFEKAYPTLDPAVQDHIMARDAVTPALFDGIVAKGNPEIKDIKVYADKAGGMRMTYTSESVTPEGQILPYTSRPTALSDSQAYTIVKSAGLK